MSDEYNNIVKTLELIRVFSDSIDTTRCCEVLNFDKEEEAIDDNPPAKAA